jgi:hypothetical protein
MVFYDDHELILLFTLVALYTSRSLRSRHHLTRGALLEPERSALQRLLKARVDSAYIDTFGFDCVTFDYLYAAFRPQWTRVVKPKVHILTPQSHQMT